MSNITSKEEIFQLILRHAREIIPDLERQNIVQTDSLESLGANSMDRADIVMDVMEALSLEIPRIELFGPRNIGELVDLIYSKLS